MSLPIFDKFKKTPEERTGIQNPTEYERESATFDRVETPLRSHAERIIAERAAQTATTKERG